MLEYTNTERNSLKNNIQQKFSKNVGFFGARDLNLTYACIFLKNQYFPWDVHSIKRDLTQILSIIYTRVTRIPFSTTGFNTDDDHNK